MKNEGLSNKLSNLLGETSDELLVARGKLTAGIDRFKRNSRNIGVLESVINFLARYEGDRTMLGQIENSLQSELKRHLEAQARLINKLPDIQLAKDSAVILAKQEETLSSFARFWKEGSPLTAWKVARTLKKNV